MADEKDDNAPETPEEDEVMKGLEDAMHKMHPEEEPPADPFATDGLGDEPAETHESWSE